MECSRITVDGKEYQLRRWRFKDGRRWLLRLTALAAAAAGDGTNASAATVLQAVDDDAFEELWQTCTQYTDLLTRSDSGEALERPLSKVGDVEMAGEYVALAEIIKGHLTQEFAPFFERIGEVLGVGQAKAT